jgi:hypothetical protein
MMETLERERDIDDILPSWWPLMIISGLFWCAWKGIKFPFNGGHRLNDTWGWTSNRMGGFSFSGKNYDEDDDVWLEQFTLPRGGKSHHRTDLIVEWNRTDPQRGAKLLCGLAALTFVAGLAIGWLL